jgi:hypothetical protein
LKEDFGFAMFPDTMYSDCLTANPICCKTWEII